MDATEPDASEPPNPYLQDVISAELKQGITSDQAKVISKAVRDGGFKGVQASIQGDQVRVTGKKRDDLQAVIALLKEGDYGTALQFTNYR